jgi:hypothetical protein
MSVYNSSLSIGQSHLLAVAIRKYMQYAMLIIHQTDYNQVCLEHRGGIQSSIVEQKLK